MPLAAWMPGNPRHILSTEKVPVSGPFYNKDYSNSFIFLTSFCTVCGSSNYQMWDKKELGHQTSAHLSKHNHV